MKEKLQGRSNFTNVACLPVLKSPPGLSCAQLHRREVREAYDRQQAVSQHQKKN